MNTHTVLLTLALLYRAETRFLDYEGIHPHISKITTAVNWKKACQYITKEDKTVVIEQEDKGNEITDIWKHTSVQEALENMESLKDALATIAVYNLKPLEKPEAEICEDEFYPWQRICGSISKGFPQVEKCAGFMRVEVTLVRPGLENGAVLRTLISVSC